MTKELTVILILTAVAVFSLVGWVVFEHSSILTQVDFSEKKTSPLNPILNTQVLQKSTELTD